LLSIFSLAVVTPIVAAYLVYDWNRMVAAIDNWVPPARRDTVRALAREVDDTISGFVRGQSALCLVLAVYYALALWLIGLKHGLVIGFAAGLISFIPYLGSLSGLVISTCVAIAQFWPDWTWILLVPAIFFVGQFMADYVLAPYLVGRRVHLSPVWVMFALFAFGYLFGFVGLLIAGPLAAASGCSCASRCDSTMRARYMLPPPPRPCPCARWMHQHLLPTRATSMHRNKRRAWVSSLDHLRRRGRAASARRCPVRLANSRQPSNQI
jgi:hypothetical protein